ncbi:methyltransferase domain-containing protein [Shewanella submarina]|uniref:tRNA 5-carboxymethoxyuridine methyltransferase n=1 Tax=Shewanella submarina TaxID=2016376 RepID=A0ABV7GBC3_9GAMM|nr:methyltransferase domain-containing protein [Shewanella submarina]
MQDKNFDSLAGKFARNIYGTRKGEIRAAVLWRDLTETLPAIHSARLRVLDAGGGFGHLSQKLAALGHEVVLCDISAEMLALAKQQIDACDTELNIKLVHSAIQDLNPAELGQFDLILCHAVVEWLVDAKSTMAGLLKMLKPGGYFSLMFFNLEAMRFHALISGNFDYVKADFKIKKKVRLTPTHPLTPDTVLDWFADWQLALDCRSGVRVIHDYLKKHLPPDFDNTQLLEMELFYSRYPAYRDLGRYVHFMGHSS